jgi:hypothetical protein
MVPKNAPKIYVVCIQTHSIPTDRPTTINLEKMASVPITPQNNFIDNIDLRMEEALNNGPPMHVNGQNYALIIYLAPQGTRQRNIEAGMMILGTFQSEELARAHIDKLARLGYVYFDIFIVQMYGFFPLPPPTDMGAQTEYINGEMNKIMQYHRRAVVTEQEEVQRRVAESREHDQEQRRRLEEKKQAGPQVDEKVMELEASGSDSKSTDEKRECTEEERRKVRMVVGEPIFVQEKDIPVGARVIDLSAASPSLTTSSSSVSDT